MKIDFSIKGTVDPFDVDDHIPLTNQWKLLSADEKFFKINISFLFFLAKWIIENPRWTNVHKRGQIADNHIPLTKSMKNIRSWMLMSNFSIPSYLFFSFFLKEDQRILSIFFFFIKNCAWRRQLGRPVIPSIVNVLRSESTHNFAMEIQDRASHTTGNGPLIVTNNRPLEIVQCVTLANMVSFRIGWCYRNIVVVSLCCIGLCYQIEVGSGIDFGRCVVRRSPTLVGVASHAF